MEQVQIELTNDEAAAWKSLSQESREAITLHFIREISIKANAPVPENGL